MELLFLALIRYRCICSLGFFIRSLGSLDSIYPARKRLIDLFQEVHSALDLACESRRVHTVLFLGICCFCVDEFCLRMVFFVFVLCFCVFVMSALEAVYCVFLYQPIICEHSCAPSCVESSWSPRYWPFSRICKDCHLGAAQQPTKLSCTDAVSLYADKLINCSEQRKL